MRWEFNRWLSAISFVRLRATSRDAGWEDHQRNMIMVTILLRSLKASVNCHYVARRSQMFKGIYKNRKGKPLRGLDFGSSMQQTGLAWLPSDLFNWRDFHLHDELVTSTSFTFNGLQGVLSNWQGVKTISREYCQAKDLDVSLRTCDSGMEAEILDQMRKMVYRHFAHQVIRQSCSDRISDEKLTNIQEKRWEGYQGLSYDIINELIGEAPYLARARIGPCGLGASYHERVQGLFDWDDGIARTLWDHCYYRQLARRFYRSISASMSHADAKKWKDSLGKHALPYFWFIPSYNKHSLFTRLYRTAERPAVTRPFVSGLYQWRVRDDDDSPTNDETRWMLGRHMYQSGCPDHMYGQNEAETEVSEIGDRVYVIDFGCPIPFTKIPPLVEEGFEKCRKVFARGDQRVLAHYESARDCLIQCLGDPLCDVLLMIVLTFASSIVTPVLPMHADCFEARPRKDPRLLAVALITRMLWFLYPQWFP